MKKQFKSKDSRIITKDLIEEVLAENKGEEKIMLKFLKELIKKTACIANRTEDELGFWEWVCERLVNWHNDIIDKKRNKYIKKTGDVGGSIEKYMYTTYGASMRTAERLYNEI